MSKTQFTLGPWHVVLSDNATPHILHEHGCDSTDYNDLSSRVCVMPSEIVADYNSLANAHLIAAAPDLYEALEELCDWYGWHTGMTAIAANAALAKARGEA